MSDKQSATRKFLLNGYAIAVVAFLYAPIVLLFIFSFNVSQYIAFPIRGWSVKWYEQMWESTRIWETFGNSLQVAIVTALLSTLIATLAAKAASRYRFFGRQAVLSFAMLPLVIPELILGIALLIFLLGVGLELSLLTVTIGHTVVCTPYALAVMMSRFAGYDRSFEEASLDLGETPLATFWRITLPLVWPGIVASLLLTFLISFDDFVIAFFLTGSDTTLPVFIYSQLRFPKKLPELLALGVIVISISIVLIIIAEWLRRRGQPNSGAQL